MSNWYIQVPAIKARKWLTDEMEKTSTILFEYGEGQDLMNKGQDPTKKGNNA